MADANQGEVVRSSLADTDAQGHQQARETVKTLNAFVDEHERPTTVHVDAA